MDVDKFRLNPTTTATAASRRVPRHKAGEWFIKGPLPGSWIGRAARLPGRALHVGLVLWYLAGVGRGRRIKPSWQVWELFGLSPYAGRRGLAALEQAGLVDVVRAPGCCPEVTILEG